MMKPWANIFKVIILIIGIIVVAFNAQLYILCKQQKAEAQVNSNKFKYQQDQIERLSKDLEDARQQIKNQNDVLADQKDESKGVQTSLVDIKAEADAIKQEVKGWQKDYVSVLAELKKKMDDSQENVNFLKAGIEKITPVPQKKDKDEDRP